MTSRSLKALLGVDGPAWPLVQSWIAKARHPVEVLPASPQTGDESLAAAQVTVRSPLGAVLHETGGLLIDHGWLRILGCGHPKLQRSAPAWNAARTSRQSGYWLVGDDALGGAYAVDSGGLGPGDGKVHYFAPDALQWEPTAFGFGDFLRWSLTGDLADYYEELRWDGWREEVAATHGDEGMFVMPPLILSGPPVKERLRRTIPIAELFDLHLDLARQLDAEPEPAA
jgi:Protein of unknown function DUF2625